MWQYISFLYNMVSPRAKKPFELKYMQHIVIIYWLCITCIPYVNYEIAKDKPPHDFSVSFYQQLWNWKYRVSKGIILSFCLLAQMHNSIASSPSHILVLSRFSYSPRFKSNVKQINGPLWKLALNLFTSRFLDHKILFYKGITCVRVKTSCI